MKRLMTAALAGVVMLSACRNDQQADDQTTGSITPADMQQARASWPEGLAAAVDSGNAAFSRDDYERALDRFQEATRIAPEVTAGWFGIYMTEHARGNIAAADSAMARVQRLSPGASLVHPDSSTPSMPAGHPQMPAGHPTTTSGN